MMICRVCDQEIESRELGVFGLAHMHEWQCIHALKRALSKSRLTPVGADAEQQTTTQCLSYTEVLDEQDEG